jgi:hypothetical protein
MSNAGGERAEQAGRPADLLAEHASAPGVRYLWSWLSSSWS